MHTCAWQSADSRVTTDHCRVTLRWVFTKSFQIAWNVQKRCLTVSRRSRDLRPLSRDRSATFFKIFSNCLKRQKNVVWQSADGRVTSTIVAWRFKQLEIFLRKVAERSRDSGRRSRDRRPTVKQRFLDVSSDLGKFWKKSLNGHATVVEVTQPSADCQTTFFGRFKQFENFLKKVAERSRDSGRRSRDRRPTVKQRFLDVSSDLGKFWKKSLNGHATMVEVTRPSADCQTTFFGRFKTFFKKISNCLKRPKNVVWQSADGRVTSTTVAWPFSDFFQNFPKSLETSKKRCLTVGRRSRDLRPLSRDRSATFFKKFSNCLKRPKNVVWQSADGRVTSTIVAWPFSDFFQNFPKSLETSKKRCLTVGRRSRDLRPLSRDRSATFFKKFSNCLKRPKNVVWQSADGCVTSTTVAWPFSDFFQNFPKSLETSKKRCLTVGRRSRDLRPLSRDRSATFLKKISNCLKRPKNVVWQSADGRVTSDHCRVTVQRLFSKFSQIAWNVQKTLFDSRPTVAWPPTTVTWPFSDFFQKNF